MVNIDWTPPTQSPSESQRELRNLFYALFDQAQILFGQRDLRFQIEPPVFGEQFGHGYAEVIARHMVCGPVLSPEMRDNWDFTVRGLSHEVVHLLSPYPGLPSTFLEEGLAEYFSAAVCDHLGVRFDSVVMTQPYREALALIEKIPESPFEVGFFLRAICGAFGAVNMRAIKRHCPFIRPELAGRLLEVFPTSEMVRVI